MTFEWLHPTSKGHVVMVATFVHNFSIYWRDVYSEIIFDTTKPDRPKDTYQYPTKSTCNTGEIKKTSPQQTSTQRPSTDPNTGTPDQASDKLMFNEYSSATDLGLSRSKYFLFMGIILSLLT